MELLVLKDGVELRRLEVEAKFVLDADGEVPPLLLLLPPFEGAMGVEKIMLAFEVRLPRKAPALCLLSCGEFMKSLGDVGPTPDDDEPPFDCC